MGSCLGAPPPPKYAATHAVEDEPLKPSTAQSVARSVPSPRITGSAAPISTGANHTLSARHAILMYFGSGEVILDADGDAPLAALINEIKEQQGIVIHESEVCWMGLKIECGDNGISTALKEYSVDNKSFVSPSVMGIRFRDEEAVFRRILNA
mmetsp:Transcript_7718/g.21115  ORF Transcript_7718/g.21115 Transcript_7718/m.21115 type:complete len:153 (+) Transcript_7718:77-535(+)